MSNFVIKMEKIKTDEAFKNRIVGHNNRGREYPHTHSNIDPEKSKNNIILHELEFKSESEIRQFAKKNMAKGKRQLQKGKAFAYEFVVDCSVINGWRDDDYIAFLKMADNFFDTHFGGFNGGFKKVHSVIHLDESKPHLHTTFLTFNTATRSWGQKQAYKSGLLDINKIIDKFEEQIGKNFGLTKGDGKSILDDFNKKVKPKKITYVAGWEKEKGLLKDVEKPILRKAEIYSKKDVLEYIKTQSNYEIAKRERDFYKKKNDELFFENIELKNKIDELKIEKDKVIENKELAEFDLKNFKETNEHLIQKNKELELKINDINLDLDLINSAKKLKKDKEELEKKLREKEKEKYELELKLKKKEKGLYLAQNKIKELEFSVEKEKEKIFILENRLTEIDFKDKKIEELENKINILENDVEKSDKLIETLQNFGKELASITGVDNWQDLIQTIKTEFENKENEIKNIGE